MSLPPILATTPTVVTQKTVEYDRWYLTDFNINDGYYMSVTNKAPQLNKVRLTANFQKGKINDAGQWEFSSEKAQYKVDDLLAKAVQDSELASLIGQVLTKLATLAKTEEII